MDPLGPMLYFPFHCAAIEEMNIHASPVIGYIEQKDNPVQEKLLDQTIQHFDHLSGLLKTLNDNKMISELITGGMDKVKAHPRIREIEALTKAYDAQVNKFSGEDRQFTKMKVPNMRFNSKKFKDKKELDDYIAHPDHGKDHHPGVCFALTMHEHKKNEKYELELFFNDAAVLDYRSIPPQDEAGAEDANQVPAFRPYAYYSFYGFAYLQNWAANTLLREMKPKKKQFDPDPYIAAVTVPMKLDKIIADPFAGLLYFILNWFVMVMFIPIVYRTTYRLVKEKELRIKESMAIMGMKNAPYWLSWLAYYTTVNTMLCLISWFILSGPILRYTSSTVVFFTLWLFGQALFGYIMLFQAFFTTARTAAVCITAIYFGSSISLNLAEHAPYWQKVCISVFPTAAMNQTVKAMMGFELNSSGVAMDQLNRVYRNYDVQTGWICFILEFIFMSLIGIYLENVIPRKEGRRAHWLFCCNKKFWCKPKVSLAKVAPNEDADFVTTNHAFETQFMNPECYEKLSTGVEQQNKNQQYLKIEGLVKQYGKDFKAVDQINLKMFADQIFVLLGHNGAGKTSLISVLTGIFEHSAGSAEAFGTDMFNNFDEIREFTGICPQHDVLFELLTVREHLEIFYDFKGGDPDQKKKDAEIDKLIGDVGLEDKADYLASKCSGGNQRKLSAVLALCGGSKLIFFDEPTSSLDLNNRRKIWTMLKEYKKDRIILLTTHYMDEADILGDRIGIMAHGKISTLGSALFLKQKFGVGYNLTMIKKSTAKNEHILPFCVKYLGSDCKQLSEIQQEVTIQIPTEYEVNFKEFFKKFDHSLPKLGISTYGVSITTLEDVFMKIGHQQDPLNDNTNIQKDMLEKRNTMFQVGSKDKDQSIEFKTESKLNPGKNQSSLPAIDQKAAASPEETPRGMLVDEEKIIGSDESSAAEQNENVYTNSTFCQCFCAVMTKRLQLFQNPRSIIYEVFIPLFIMVFGISLTNIDLFQRSASAIIHPSRMTNETNLLLFNSGIALGQPGDTVNATTFAKGLPDQEKHFDVRMTNSSMSFDDFYDFSFLYGRAHRPKMPYMYAAYQMYQADTKYDSYMFYSYVNMTQSEGVSLYPQFMYESILKVATGNPDFEYKVRNTPYPNTNEVTKRKVNGISLGICFLLATSFCLLTATIMGQIVHERVTGLKHHQLISGLDLAAYWVANFLADLIKMEIVIAGTLIALWANGMKWPDATLPFILFPFAVIPLTYVTSFLFAQVSSAQTFTIAFNFGSIIFLTLVVGILRWIQIWEYQADIIHHVCKIFPQYTFGQTIFFSAQQKELVEFREATRGTGRGVFNEPWIWQNVLGDCVSLAAHFVLWSFVIFLIESGLAAQFKAFYSCCCKLRFPDPLDDLEIDEEVREEEKRVATSAEQFQIKVDNIRKVYVSGAGCCSPGKPLRAIERLSFGLQKGECFALLGVNGAGKSTAFKTIVAAEEPTSGNITIQGLDIVKDFRKARKMLGYCPQFNPLFDALTVEQNLRYFARLKGLPKVEEVIEDAIQRLDLIRHRKKAAGDLSGGNKRKLSVGIAIIGNPPIVLLDEPSAGMDPEARRFMWSVVSEISRQKTSAVILTSHMMEEAEALCTKMGIMVKGGIFKCFGSSQHIKDKFGDGYEVDIKITIPIHAQLIEYATKELSAFVVPGAENDDSRKVHVRMALKSIYQAGMHFVAEQIRLDIVAAFKLSKEVQIEAIDDMEYDFEMKDASNTEELVCPANFFAEKLYTQKHQHGIMKAICMTFGWLELLEMYGNYMRVRVSRQEKTIGQMFGLIDDLKKDFQIDNHSVSQTTLEQIFQKFAKLSFDQNVQTFALNDDGQDITLL